VTATPSPTVTATPTATPTPVPLQAKLWLEPMQIVQGDAAVVRVKGNRSYQVSGVVGDRMLGFVAHGEFEYVALLGVDAMAKTETRPLTVTLHAEDGQELELTTQAQIVPGRFGQEQIILSHSVSELLDPAIAEPERKRVAQIVATFTPKILWKGAFQWPVEGPITSEFGTRRGYGGSINSYHEGLDIGGTTGTVIRAAADGVVLLAEKLQVRGNAVYLDHGAGVISAYFHMDSLDVKVGQTVRRGDPLGKMGSTGLATGPHLHWQLHVNSVAVNPKEWLERVFAEPSDGM
jgi:murein DD-endopeptidase MepM/ murein hydrolase activator NlpD